MELRSGRRVASQPPPEARRRCQPRRIPDGVGMDRISALPDDLLLEILIRLPSTRAAARTGLLSSRWRGLWAHLPVLSFTHIAPDAVTDAIREVAVPALSFLQIVVDCQHPLVPARVSALLQGAARLAPEELFVHFYGKSEAPDVAVEVPCFDRATSIELTMWDHHLTLPAPAPGSGFPWLERLSLRSCRVDPEPLAQLCPRLRVLQIWQCIDWGFDTIKIHSSTIEELFLLDNFSVGGVDIIAPALKKLELRLHIGRNFSFSFSAPAVEYLSWEFMPEGIWIDEIWGLRRLKLGLWVQERVPILRLNMNSTMNMSNIHKNLMQGINRLHDVSVLEVYLAGRHVYAATMLNLLGICTNIQRLKVVTTTQDTNVCSQNCPCHLPQNWRSQYISLTCLEEVEMKYFIGADHEVDFLKLLFKCAPLMERMSVKLLATVQGCEKIYDLFKVNPSVRCAVYLSNGQVLYAS